MAHRVGREWFVVFRTRKESRGPLVHATAHLRQIALSHPKRVSPAVEINESFVQEIPESWVDDENDIRGYFWPQRKIYRAQNIFVERRSGLLFLDGSVVAESGQLYSSATTDADWYRLPLNVTLAPRVSKFGDPAIVVPPIYAYWHWLLEWFPRVLRTIAANSNVAVLLCGDIPDYVNQCLVNQNLRHAQVREDMVLCDAYVPEKNNYLWVYPQDVSLIRDAAALSNGYELHRKNRVYVSRRLSRRSLRHEEMVENELAREGLDIFLPGQITWQEQVKMFAQAKTIVGPYGSGLANMALMQPSASVVEIRGSELVDSCVRNLAASCGHRWQSIRHASDNNYSALVKQIFDALENPEKPAEEPPSPVISRNGL